MRSYASGKRCTILARSSLENVLRNTIIARVFPSWKSITDISDGAVVDVRMHTRGGEPGVTLITRPKSRRPTTFLPAHFLFYGGLDGRKRRRAFLPKIDAGQWRHAPKVRAGRVRSASNLGSG